MPQLTEILKKRSQGKFVKKSYRPWDLKGFGSETSVLRTVESNDEILQEEQESKINHPIQIINENIPTTKPEIIEQLLDNNKASLREQLDIKKTSNNNLSDSNQASIKKQLNISEISNKKQLEINQITNREQIDNKNDPLFLLDRLLKLAGIQRKILELCVTICEGKRTLYIKQIETKTIAEYINSSYGVTKLSLSRLINKGFLFRQKGKTAKGGFLNLELPPEVFEGVLYIRNNYESISEYLKKSKTNFLEIDNKLDIKSPIYSSSSYNNKITTDLPEDWKKINLDPLRHIKFCEHHLKQILNLNTPEIVQESINHYAFALETNEKYKNHKTPLNVIMGVLRQGKGWFESSYRSPQEIAMEQMIERKKAERERMKKLEDEVYKFALAEWKETLSAEQIEEIAPPKKHMGDIMPQDIKLSIYFKEKIWPHKKSDYLIKNYERFKN